MTAPPRDRFWEALAQIELTIRATPLPLYVDVFRRDVGSMGEADYRDVAELARLRTALRDCRDAAYAALAESKGNTRRKPALRAAESVIDRAKWALREG